MVARMDCKREGWEQGWIVKRKGFEQGWILKGQREGSSCKDRLIILKFL